MELEDGPREGHVGTPEPQVARPGSGVPESWSVGRFPAMRNWFTGRHLLVMLCGLVGLGAGILLYTGVFSAGTDTAPPPPPDVSAAPEPRVVRAEPQVPEAAPSARISWTVAEQAFASGRCDEALAIYSGLLQEAEKSPVNRGVSDFLRLRRGQCLRRLDRVPECRQAFLEAVGGASPFVRAVACFEMARMDAADGQALMARMRTCQALAALGDPTRHPGLETGCEFMAAYALTTKALSLFGQTLPSPQSALPETDFFEGLAEAQLRALLDEGVERLDAAVLDPKVQRRQGERGTSLWAVASNNAPLEDVLSRLSAQAGIDITWAGVGDPARRRPVVLDLSGVSALRLVEVACGAAGLVARFTGNEAVVTDPASCASTAAAQDLLVREAVSMWRRFLLRGVAAATAREAYARFALGAIQQPTGDGGAAIAEYRLVAERFPLDRLAPEARLRMAVIKIDLRDYAGARVELLELLNHYPDCPKSDEVYLRLGQAALEAGRLDEAFATYRKLYFMDLSLASKAGAALGAAQCASRQGQGEEAVRWVTRRLELRRSPAVDVDLPEVYGLLAKAEAARGRLPQAVQAYREAVKASPKGAERVATLLELARLLTRQEDFVAALGVLEGLTPKDATAAQADEILVARAEILRGMCMPERAAGLLRHALPTVSSPRNRTRLVLELAACTADIGDLRGALQMLNDLLPTVEPGPLAHRAALALADLCVRNGRQAQAIALARGLLAPSSPDEIRQSAQQILGRAYAEQKDYERAAVALSGAAAEPQGAPKP